jgi:hypothetical protein
LGDKHKINFERRKLLKITFERCFMSKITVEKQKEANKRSVSQQTAILLPNSQ